MWAVLNPGKRRSRKSKGRKGGRRKHRISARGRRRISAAARRRSTAKAFKAGFEGGMRQCGRLVARAAHRRKASSYNTRHLPAAYAGNPRRRRRNPMYMPSYGYNPGTAIMGNVKKAYSMDGLKSAGLIVGGAVANGFVSGFVSGLPFVPDFLKDGYGKAGLQLATAGVTAALTNMVAPRFAQPALIGGALTAMVTGIRASGFGPSVGFSGLMRSRMRGMNDWLKNDQPQINAPVANPQLGGLMEDNCNFEDQGSEF